MIKISKVFFILFLTFIVSKKSNSFNLFELSMMGVGVGFIAGQYFDSSLEQSNTFELKRGIIDYHIDNSKSKPSSKYYMQLPIHEKLRLIEELNKF